ncbi:tryptophan transporter [Anaeroselena agilis]|uniref:Tryptophan transporter n=1 Tax=Anaeroselena agilis TaxID=3063788 RepID=A0ABU3P248_9FIRM|nr:tryptophan transporter [Selenomonadales bacterium 4137-cl]
MENRNDQEMVRVEKTGGNTRGIAVTALLLAIGVILRLVSPSIAGITPNWLIAMYCLAILVVRPGFKQAAGIGLVAGVVCMVTSKAIFPYANLISEPVGAVACALVAGLTGRLKVLGLTLQPAVSTFIGTLASGFVFITVTKIVMSIPMQVYVYGMMPVVLTVGAVNCVVAQVLYFPAMRLFAGKTAVVTKEEKA